MTDSPNLLLNLLFRRFSIQKIETGLKIEAAAEIRKNIQLSSAMAKIFIVILILKTNLFFYNVDVNLYILLVILC